MTESSNPEGLSPEVMGVIMDNTRAFVESGLAGKYHAALRSMVDLSGEVAASPEVADSDDQKLKDIISGMQSDARKGLTADLPLAVRVVPAEESELFERKAGNSYSIVKVDPRTGDAYFVSDVNVGYIDVEGQRTLGEAIPEMNDDDFTLVVQRATAQQEIGFNPSFPDRDRPAG